MSAELDKDALINKGFEAMLALARANKGNLIAGTDGWRLGKELAQIGIRFGFSENECFHYGTQIFRMVLNEPSC